MKLKIMTFNIQHGLGYLTRVIDLHAVADVIRAQNPDLVVLNEVRGAGTHPEYTAQTEALADDLGWHDAFGKALDVPGGGPYGNAILSPHPFTAETFPIPVPADAEPSPYHEPRCVMRAVFAEGKFEQEPFTVFGSHFGLTPQEARDAAATVCTLADREEKPFVFMGDLNLTPESPILDPIRARMHDAAEVFASPLFSFPSDAPDRKIDYIFASPKVTFLFADIPAVVVSDHRCHTAEISY